MDPKSFENRDSIAHEAVCNTVASLTEQLKADNLALTTEQWDRLKWDLEKRIRTALRGAKYTHNANEIEV